MIIQFNVFLYITTDGLTDGSCRLLYHLKLQLNHIVGPHAFPTPGQVRKEGGLRGAEHCAYV